MVVGSTGYIGKFVVRFCFADSVGLITRRLQVRELIRRGFNVIAFAREKSGISGASSAEQTKQVTSQIQFVSILY